MKVYTHAEALDKFLGGAKSLRLHPVGFRLNAGGKLVLKVWESAFDGIRPSQLTPGGSPLFTSADITTLRPAPVQVNGPFCGLAEVTLEVSNTGGAQTEWDGLLAVTAIYEE